MEIIGVVLDKKYIVDKHIGGGAMGQVYLGRRKSDLLPVAIKIMNSDKATSKKFKARFKHEIKTQCRLDHPNLVRGYDSGEYDNCPYLVMEYVDGPSLDQLIQKRGFLKPEEALKIILDVAMGLNGIVVDGSLQAHRDIKPQNIMLDPDGIAKITDFGIAKIIETDNTMTRTSANMGTPYYMSPEQINDPRDADVRSDIYAVGAVFYELLTGKKAFPGKNTKEIWDAHFELEPPNISGDDPAVAPINEILDRSMAFDVQDRFQSPKELIESLVPLTDETIQTKVPKVARSTRQLVGVLLIILAIVTGGVTLVLRLMPEKATVTPSPAPAAVESNDGKPLIELEQADVEQTTIGETGMPEGQGSTTGGVNTGSTITDPGTIDNQNRGGN